MTPARRRWRGAGSRSGRPAAHLAVLVALLGASAAPAGAALIPGQGQLVRVGTAVAGPCQVDTPAYPDTSSWGSEHDGTPYNSTEVYTEFFVLQPPSGDPVQAGGVDSVGWGRGDVIRPETNPSSGLEYCDFYSDTAHPPPDVTSWPVHVRGIWLMRTHTVTNAKTFDSVNGWVPAAGDGRDVTQDVKFDVVDTNSCRNSAWVGIGPTDPACLKDKEKQEARQAAKEYEAAHTLDQESSKGLGCGPGASNYDSNETKYACAAISAKNIYDAQMASHEQQLANDPPESYTSIAKPKPVRTGKLRHVLPALRSFRAIVLDLAHAAAAHGALATTINRANGAYAATPTDPAADGWTQRQDVAAEKDTSAALARLGDAADRMAAAHRELLAARVPRRIATRLLKPEARAIKLSVTLLNQLGG